MKENIRMRIYGNNAYICNNLKKKMKSRLNITVDEILMEQAKRYAEKHKTSLSKLIETYFRNLIRPANKKNVIDLVESLPKPSSRVTENKENLKENFFKSQKRKYGF